MGRISFYSCLKLGRGKIIKSLPDKLIANICQKKGAISLLQTVMLKEKINDAISYFSDYVSIRQFIVVSRCGNQCNIFCLMGTPL